MKLHRLFCLSGMLLVSTVGCCQTQCVSSSPCNSCGSRPSCGSCFSNWLSFKVASYQARRCHNYSWGDDCSGGCSVCGGSNCGMADPVMGGGAYGASPSCGCGQPHNHAPVSPTPAMGVPTESAPVPVPNNSLVPRTNEPIPAPGATDSTTFQRPANGQIQHVSVEEFQRLPGVVVSGPTQSSVPTMAAQTIPMPLSTVAAPPRPVTPVQQAQWVPAR